jgi:glycosyltransferase involved in cell wall biosynthesis
MTDGMTIPSAISSERASVDVVIPTRNRARFIRHCLDSVRAQTLQPDGVIVVDDGSTDDTAAVLAEYARAWPALRVVRTPPRGVSAARNSALALSTAQLIALIDDDDVWDPDKLARQVELFNPDRPRLALVHCGLRQIDPQGEPIKHAPVVLPSKRGDVFKDMLERFYGIAPSTIVARRDVILSVGGFDEGLVQGEDRDLCMKIARLAEIDYVPDALIGLRIHGGGAYIYAMRHSPDLVLFQRLKVWDRWFDEIDDMDAVLRRFRAEALSACISMLLRPRPKFGLYRRLASSELRLARQLFPDRRAYIRSLLSYLVPLPSFTSSKAVPRVSAYVKLKLALATHVILPNIRLLRLGQKFGRFRNVEPPVTRSHGGLTGPNSAADK